MVDTPFYCLVCPTFQAYAKQDHPGTMTTPHWTARRTRAGTRGEDAPPLVPAATLNHSAAGCVEPCAWAPWHSHGPMEV